MQGSKRAGLAPALALTLNAFVWGVSWWPFRELHALGLHPLWATALIYFVSLSLLLVVKPQAWRDFAKQPLLWLLLVASGLTNVGFNWGVTVGDVVRVVLLFYLMPAWTVILAWIFLGERPTPGSMLRLVIAMTGVFVVLKSPDTPWPVPQSIADWLAIAGGISFATTNIVLRRLRHVEPPARILAMFTGGAVLAGVSGLIGVAAGIVPAIPAPHTGWIAVGFALSLGFLASNIALQFGAARLDAHASALIMLSEIVFASVTSVALGAAEMTVRTWIGGGLILFAAAWSALAHNGESTQPFDKLRMNGESS
jgi:drug/metabolite transporter (DMT)-like permease